MSIGIGLRQVQEALDRKGNLVQQEFIRMSDELDELGHKIIEAEGEEKKALKEEQRLLRERQRDVAEEVNLWRRRARDVLAQPGEGMLRTYLNKLLELDEPTIVPSIDQALKLLDTPPEERGPIDATPDYSEQTPVERLIERARTEYDLRASDPGVRQREAVAFANRLGLAQDEQVLVDIAAAMRDPDPLVAELATLTTIQLYRFRAIRFADLDEAHEAVQFLARLNHPSVIPVLVEVATQRRVGYVQQGGEGEHVERHNNRSRMVALLRLVKWHTAEAKLAIQKLCYDQDAHIAKAAERALELFPGPWTGKIPRKEGE
ncbi:MAG: hypothetical protein P1P76_01540 [Anaerolineales bacterium]|nr:hypothetical protein [Anaerolineales bacterium]